MIEIKDLVKTYETEKGDVKALRGINLEINDGEIYGVIGLSGAGKSSLVRCINLLERPTSGEIIVDGVDLSKSTNKDLRESRKKIGMVFQHFNLLKNKTVFDNIAFPMIISGCPKDRIKKKVDELIELVGLTGKENVYPSQLSGGQKQRVGIARALSNEPKLIMCDEATSALDPSTTKQILELLREVNKKLNITIIIITHEMEVIKNICHRVAIMEDGVIIEKSSVRDILIDPSTDTAKEFFGKVDMESRNLAYQKARTGKGKIINAIFVGETSTDPFISYMVKNYDIAASILLGHIEEQNDELIGNLVLKLTGDNDEIDRAIDYLIQSGVKVEVESVE